MCGLLLGATANAQYAYLDDANEQPDMPKVAGGFPKIMSTETQSDAASGEQFSKYDLLGTKTGMMYRVQAAQAINPKVEFHYSFHPGEYLGYISKDPCDIAFGMGFNKTTGSTDPNNCSVYAGHWLYRAGTKLTAGINNTANTLRVQDAGKLQAGKYAVIYSGGPGKFQNAEHVLISGVDKSVTPHRVTLSQRGYKSTPRSHGTNAIIAVHAIGTGGSNKNWAWNISTTGVRDGSGRFIADVFVDWIPKNMNKNAKGKVMNVRVDGIYFDADFQTLTDGQVDVNNDLVADGGILGNGNNVWSQGMNNFYCKLRSRLPGKRIVGGWRQTHGFECLNGVQMENFLVNNKSEFSTNPEYRGNFGLYSQLHNYMMHLAYHKPDSGYTETLVKLPSKLYPGTVKSGSNPKVPANNSSFRLTFGASLLGSGWYGRQNSSKHPDPWHDEYAVDVRPGSSAYGQAIKSNPTDESRIRANKGWLGRPLGKRTRIYNADQFKPSRSLITNGGLENGVTGWQINNLNYTLDRNQKVSGNQSLAILGHSKYAKSPGGASLRGPAYKMVAGRTYTLVFTAKASRMRDVFLKMDWSGNQGNYLIADRWTRVVYTVQAKQSGTFRPVIDLGREDTPFWIDEMYVFEGDPNVFRRDFEKGIVVVNATAQARTVNLGATYQRIRGTGQDPINNGQKLSQVTIPAFDAAILVRPDGSGISLPPASGGGDIDDGGTSGGSTGGTGTVNVGTGNAALGGEAWRDNNGNGIQDSNDAGWGGVTMRLLTCGDAEIRRVATASDGSYRFNNIKPGSYKIGVVRPTGASLSPAFKGTDGGKDSNIQSGNVTACMTLNSGQKKLAVDAGLIPSGSSSGGDTGGSTGGSTGSAQIGDFVWADWNSNGIQDQNEGGRPNVRIQLQTCSGQTLQSLTTDKSGRYSFSVAPGSYQLKFTPAAGERLSPSFRGTNGAIDSNVNPSNGLTACTVLNKGDVKGWVDAGVIP